MGSSVIQSLKKKKKTLREIHMIQRVIKQEVLQSQQLEDLEEENL